MSTDPESLSASPATTAGTFSALLREVGRASHWAQLMRFATVGLSGYVVNLAVFWAALNAQIEYRAAATAAFVVALVNNFAWNRVWTFRDSAGRLGGQAFRFVVVSVAAFVVSLAVLSVLVRDAGVPKLLAQAAAIVAVTPLSFLANKFWSFRTSRA
jgi:dolichol-phosphate mannosyltransferase